MTRTEAQHRDVRANIWIVGKSQNMDEQIDERVHGAEKGEPGGDLVSMMLEKLAFSTYGCGLLASKFMFVVARMISRHALATFCVDLCTWPARDGSCMG